MFYSLFFVTLTINLVTFHTVEIPYEKPPEPPPIDGVIVVKA